MNCPKGPLQNLSYIDTIFRVHKRILEKLMYKLNLPEATASKKKITHKSTYIHQLVPKLDTALESPGKAFENYCLEAQH